MDVKEEINFCDPQKENDFWNYAKTVSIKHAPTGIDYFIFNKNTFRKIPDLVIGRFGWDNWLLWYARRNFMALIDLSLSVFAIHTKSHLCFQRFQKFFCSSTK